MKDKIIKKGIIMAIALVLAGTFFVPMSSGEINVSSIPVSLTIDQSGEFIEINYQIDSYSEEKVIIDVMEYSIFNIGKESNLLLEGKPDIPTICRSIVIPDTSKMKIDVVSTTYEEYDDILIAPSKGNLLRTVNPDDVDFEFGEVYNIDAWFPEDIASLRDPYIIRDFRGQVVEIYPIQYNPVTKQMRFYTNIEVEIYSDGIDTINVIYRESWPEKVDFEFNSIYNHHFINFGRQGRYDPVSEQGNMLVIVYDSFWDEMVPFVNWKNIKGIPTEMVNVSEIGSSNDIKTYIENYYNSDGLTFVLLVGDAAQVPTYYPTYHASDPSYSYIVGNDHYPDLFVGRFSAETVDQLHTQVERTLEYEQNPQTGTEWYKKGLGVASNQGPGDDGEYDDEHMDNIRDKLLAYTYIQVDQSYDYTGTTAYIAASLNEGRSITNYCGHGSPTSWGNGGGFSNSNVDALVNDNMLPFITSVACNNGEFDGYTCFAEAWMRATNNGEPTGSIANFMSSKSQSWNPPMDAQDEIIDLFIETYPDLHITSFGAAAFNGCMHMNDEYGGSGDAETDAWHVFGDPSVQIRTDTPSILDARHDTNIDVTTWTLEVEVVGVEGALCALSRDNEFFGSAYTNENGIAIIEVEDTIGTDPLDLAVTAFNKIPYITEVLINSQPEIPDKPDGPTKIKVNEETNYSTSSIDLDGDEIWFMWKWGDGNMTDWLGPYNSGDNASASHTWSESSNYQIKVKAKDTFGQETNWSEPLMVEVEKSKSINRPFINFLNSHPNLFPLLQLLVQLLEI
jgi:hypothetical protein